MGPRVIGIFLQEEDLSRKLAGYWGKKAPQYEYRTYSEAETVLEDIRAEPMYLFISDREGYECFAGEQEDFTVNAVGRLVMFREGAEDTVPEWSGRQINPVWRYRPADELLAESLGMREGVSDTAVLQPGLKADPADRSGFEGIAGSALPEVPAGQIRVFGIWSPVGRCGKTRFALALAREAAERSAGRALYMSLEVFSDIYGLPGAGGLDISDLIYHLGEGSLDEKVWERAAARTYGAPGPGSAVVISGAANPEDVTGLSPDTVSGLLECCEEAGFAAAVLDIGASYPRPDTLFGLCTEVYAPVTDSEYSRRKWEHFCSYMRARGRAELLDRAATLVLPDAGAAYDQEGSPLIPEILELFVRRLPCWSA